MFEQRVGRASPVSDIDCKPHGAVKRVAAWNLHYDVTVTLCSGVTRLTAHTHTHTCLSLQRAHSAPVALQHTITLAIINGSLIGKEL